MKRTLLILLTVLWMLGATGCVFYTTGETEVGVRTRKFALTGKGVEDKAYAPGSTYIFLRVWLFCSEFFHCKFGML